MANVAPHLRALDALLAVATGERFPSRSAICAKAEVHTSALFHALSGRRPLPDDALERLCKTLGVDPSALRALDTTRTRSELTHLEREFGRLRDQVDSLLEQIEALRSTVEDAA